MNNKALAMELLEFLEWVKYGGVDDIFELIDNPEVIINKYINEDGEL